MPEPVLNAEEHPSGRRYLLRDKDKPYEVFVMEWAPSRVRVKIQYAHKGYKKWIEPNEDGPFVVEVLPINS